MIKFTSLLAYSLLAASHRASALFWLFSPPHNASAIRSIPRAIEMTFPLSSHDITVAQTSFASQYRT